MKKVSFNKRMNVGERVVITFLIGGVGYGLIEVIWRGHTHFSMVITGGACLLMIDLINKAMSKRPFILRAAVCATAITAVEFAVGCIVNRGLGLGVWDYSGEKFNLMGQICPLYSLFWFLICALIILAVSKFNDKSRAK